MFSCFHVIWIWFFYFKHWADTEGWNPSESKTRSCLACAMDNNAVDYQAPTAARVSQSLYQLWFPTFSEPNPERVHSDWRMFKSITVMESSLFQAMVSHLRCAKSFTEQMLIHCQLHPCKQNPMKHEFRYNNVLRRKGIWRCYLAKWRSFCSCLKGSWFISA